MIVDRLIEAVKEKAVGKHIEDLRIGLGYTAVKLNDNSCGVAYTFRNELGPCCTLFDNAGDLIGVSCAEVIKWAKDINLLKSAIGTAIINALLQKDIKEFGRGNIFDEIDLKEDDIVGAVGNLKPLTQGRWKQVKKMYIFERGKVEGKDIYPDYAIDMYLPECNVVVVTATSIINKTIDHILEKCTNARQIAVVGPSTPLCPKVFREYGVDLIGGIKVVDPERILSIVSQAGGTRCFRDSVQQVVINI